MSATMTALTPCPMFLDGKWIQPNIASTPVFNPSTGEVIAQCPAGGAAEVNAAVESAHAAFPAWRDTPLEAADVAVTLPANLVEPLRRELLCQVHSQRPHLGRSPTRGTASLWQRQRRPQ